METTNVAKPSKKLNDQKQKLNFSCHLGAEAKQRLRLHVVLKC